MFKDKKFKVAGWTLYNRDQKQFSDCHPDISDEEWAEVEDSVIKEIRKKKYKFGGNYHQYGDFGCPVMSDGSVFMVSMRHWGDLMSRVWGGTYCDYAWGHDMGKVPSKHGKKPLWMTAEEISERDKEIQAAKERADAAYKARHAEDLKTERKIRAQDLKDAEEYLSKAFKGVADADRAKIARLLIKVMKDCKDPNCKGFKWIVSPAVRKRDEEERKASAKKWLEKMSKITAGDYSEETEKET